MSELKLDARKFRFLNNPEQYLSNNSVELELVPLKRQFSTVKEILNRFQQGHGVLLADDVGLGKTTVGALVAWVVACQGGRVRIYAPNEVLRRRWAEELGRHIPALQHLGGIYENAAENFIKQGDIRKLGAKHIQVATHNALKNEQRTACDLMIIDEAHRAKGESSEFNEALQKVGDRAKRKLILTATPFSIRLAELEQLLGFVGASTFESVRNYANILKQLHFLGDGHDAAEESKRLVDAAKDAIEELQPYVIRHGIDDLSKKERSHYGIVEAEWKITSPNVTHDQLSILLRMDRIRQLAPEKRGERRNDPRFHIGWQHLKVELNRAKSRIDERTDWIAHCHVRKTKKMLDFQCKQPHPKIVAVSNEIKSIINDGEKVLVFCHHRVTANELLGELEESLKVTNISSSPPKKDVWREAWQLLLFEEQLWSEDDEALVQPILDWLCSAGLQWQIGTWIGEQESTAKSLANQFRTIKPRNISSDKVPTIFEAVKALINSLLNEQSTSTRKLLENIYKQQSVFGGQKSHFPGALDKGFRTMGAWDHDDNPNRPHTLYSGKPDIVIALFNSPFGPDVLIATDRLSEGVDLHRCCRHLIHYELDPSPVRTIQRNGRVRRVGSWAALTNKPICYAYPVFGGTRDEKSVNIMQNRISAFGLLLGGVPSLDDENFNEETFVAEVLRKANHHLNRLNRKLCG